MRMENFPSSDNVINSNSKETEYLNHNFLKNDETKKMDNISKCKGDNADNHIVAVCELNSKEKTNSFLNEKSSLPTNEGILETNIDGETNGEVNAVYRVESKSTLLEVSDKESDIAVSSNSDENRTTKEVQKDINGDDSFVADFNQVTKIDDANLPEKCEIPRVELVQSLDSDLSEKVSRKDEVDNGHIRDVVSKPVENEKLIDLSEPMEIDDVEECNSVSEIVSENITNAEERLDQTGNSQDNDDSISHAAKNPDEKMCGAENSSEKTASETTLETALDENFSEKRSDENNMEKTTNKDNQTQVKESTADENVGSKNTEVLHVDENDEETLEAIDVDERDPFDQVIQITTEIEEMEVDGVKEINTVAEINETSPDESSDSTPKSVSEKRQSSEDLNKDDEEHCIIPDEVNDSAKTVEPSKQITPVRLEKLMDPSKFANSKETSLVLESTSSRPQRKAAKKAESQIKEIVAQTEGETIFGNLEDIERLSEQSLQLCSRCCRLRKCKFIASVGSKTVYICQESCASANANANSNSNANANADKTLPILKFSAKIQPAVGLPKSATNSDTINFARKCSHCGLHNISDDKSLSWEAMDFCNEDCLSRYQTKNGSFCAFCKGVVLHASMGKYSVRFGLEARQFCSGSCLEEFKKGLKSCCYCQQNITNSANTVTAQIGDKGQLKDFCSQNCVEKYERMNSNLPLPVVQDMCTVCAQKKNVQVQIQIQSKTHALCSDVCFMAFKYANNISDIDQCHICKKYYEDQNSEGYFIFHEDQPYHFCSKVCMNVFILFRRKIVPCSWCKVKKYNFDMLKKSSPSGGSLMMCSLNCLTLYQVSINATSTRKVKCDLCSTIAYAQYHLTMSDATIRNFCTYNCVMIFQTQYNKAPLTLHDPSKSSVVPVPLGGPKRAVFQQKSVGQQNNDVPRTSAVQKTGANITNGLLPQFTASTATIKLSSPLTVATASGTNVPSVISAAAPAPPPPPKYIQQIIVKPPEPKDVSNMATQCHPNTATKEVSCEPEVNSVQTQTDEYLKYPAVVPIPVPIYVPVPMHMFTTPFPVPVPFALPIPVPIFIPTPKNTYKGVVQYMKEIVDKTPTNPLEADLLLMAKMVAGEDQQEETEEVPKNESGDEEELSFADAAPDLSDSETFADAETSSVSNNFNEDVLQMALKMATEQLSNSPTVDLEAELTSNTITPQTQTEDSTVTSSEVAQVPIETKPPRTRKRTIKTATDTPSRKRRQPVTTPTESDANTSATLSQTSSDLSSPPLTTTEVERVDVNMCLKFTIGIRAWKQWVLTKNDQIEQAAAAANKKAKTFNTNILKLTTDELNYLLCLFVKEVRKPNGMEYAPDTIYYLCLSIQQYLFENGRIDNIFTDTFYEPFTNALDEVAKKFSEVNDATQYIVTRVEEEHLWESKQLGAHSPHVLLATLMFFNTKYFNLATLEEHMQLSFSHIMKHWKRNPNMPAGKPGSPAPNRNVVLRFYPPQAALDAPNSRKKKVYEQHENEVNPLRCPVKLYEFYLSKCPESVKQRNDVFYLQPERSCVPDSPVWYSTMPLQKDLLMKMLHRIRMVKEVNISLLAS